MYRRLLYSLVVAIAGAISTQAVAQNIVQYVPEPLLMNGSDLVPVCRHAAETHYLAQGASIYNWTASYYDRGDGLYVDGRLHANGNTYSVGALQRRAWCARARSGHDEDRRDRWLRAADKT